MGDQDQEIIDRQETRCRVADPGLEQTDGKRGYAVVIETARDHTTRVVCPMSKDNQCYADGDPCGCYLLEEV